VEAHQLAPYRPDTKQIFGIFGTHHAGVFFCGLHPGDHHPPSFFSAEKKAEHLERAHGAYVYQRDADEGGGYAYTATIPA